MAEKKTAKKTMKAVDNPYIQLKWQMTEDVCPEYIIKKGEHISKPYDIRKESIVFFVRPEQKLYYGFFNGDQFIAYDNHALTVLDTFKVTEVSCWIYVSECLNAKPEDHTMVNINVTKYSALLLMDDTHLYDMVNTIDKFCYEKVTLIIGLPLIPAFATTYTHQIQNYKWDFVDDKDGIYTYNIFMKFWPGWKLIKAISTLSQKKAYDHAEKLLKLLSEEL